MHLLSLGYPSPSPVQTSPNPPLSLCFYFYFYFPHVTCAGKKSIKRAHAQPVTRDMRSVEL
jgi:hypothetical protein